MSGVGHNLHTRCEKDMTQQNGAVVAFMLNSGAGQSVHSPRTDHVLIEADGLVKGRLLW